MKTKAKQKILIVEDSPEILQLTTHILTSRGYEIIPLHSGREAFDSAKSHKPDLIILDMFLDDEHGLDICQAIKSDPQIAQIPIIITTGHNIPSGTDASQKDYQPPDAYLLKPFEMEELLDKITKLLPAKT